MLVFDGSAVVRACVRVPLVLRHARVRAPLVFDLHQALPPPRFIFSLRSFSLVTSRRIPRTLNVIIIPRSLVRLARNRVLPQEAGSPTLLPLRPTTVALPLRLGWQHRQAAAHKSHLRALDRASEFGSSSSVVADVVRVLASRSCQAQGLGASC